MMAPAVVMPAASAPSVMMTPAAATHMAVPVSASDLNHRVVWRGSATQTLEQGPSGNPMKDAKTVEKPIRKAVEKMFKQYPRPS